MICIRGTRALAIAGSVLLTSAISGCSFFQSPYTDHPTYTSGEKGSMAFGAISDTNSTNCADDGHNAPDCKFIGKVILTKPTDNVSFQVFQKDGTTVMCASPAEAAKSISTTAALSAALNVMVAGAPASQAASASASATEALLALQATDAPTHFVATATYANCLAYASGMLTAAQASEAHTLIIKTAPSIGAAASAAGK